VLRAAHHPRPPHRRLRAGGVRRARPAETPQAQEGWHPALPAQEQQEVHLPLPLPAPSARPNREGAHSSRRGAGRIFRLLEASDSESSDNEIFPIRNFD
jgi:hypothetical protein